MSKLFLSLVQSGARRDFSFTNLMHYHLCHSFNCGMFLLISVNVHVQPFSFHPITLRRCLNMQLLLSLTIVDEGSYFPDTSPNIKWNRKE